MAIRNDFAPGEVLAAADLNDTFGSKLTYPSGGANGDALIKDGTAALWGSAGKIRQVVRATDSTNRATTSTSYVDVTGMSVTITPQKSDSAILILAIGFFVTSWATGDEGRARLRIADSSNNPISGAEETEIGLQNITGTSTRAASYAVSLTGYATPSTLDAVTYKLRFRTSASTNVTVTAANNTNTGQMYAIEVSA
jgi:hypothetical protein